MPDTRRIVKTPEFGEVILKELDQILKKRFPDLKRGTVDLALSFRVTVGKDGDCVCHNVCTSMPDGGVECAIVCTGTGCS
jgi:hypothetical protein